MTTHTAFVLTLMGFPFAIIWITMAIFMRADYKREKLELDETRKMLKEAR